MGGRRGGGYLFPLENVPTCKCTTLHTELIYMLDKKS